MSSPLSQFQIEDSARLREYFSIIRVRKWSVIVITLIATFASVVFAMKEADVYTSTTRIQISNPIAAFLPVSTSSLPNTGTEEEVALSSTVSTCAHFIYLRPNARPATMCTPERYADASLPDWWLEGVSTDVPTATSVLEISFTDEDAKTAQEASTSYAEAYVFYKQQQALRYVNDLRAPLLALQTSLSDQAAKLTKTVNEDTAALETAAAQQDPAQLQSASARLQADQSQLSSVNAQLAATQQQIVTADPAKITPPTIISDAALETSPSNELFKILVIAVGVLAGLTIGVGQAFIRYRLDDRIRGRNDLESRLGVPVIATVPHVRRRVAGGNKGRLITLEKRWSPASEAYRALRTTILFLGATERRQITLVTSCGEGEGKTTTCANLAVVLAEAEKRVVLISGDLRKPRLASFFGLPEQTVGVTNVLTGEADLDAALHDTHVEGLRVLPSGPIPGRPIEMLLSPAFTKMLEDLRHRADFVIMDMTPLLVVADAKEVARFADQVLFVADASSTSRTAIARARKELALVDVPVVGAVLNNFKASHTVEYSEYSHRRYRYGYRQRKRREPAPVEPAPVDPAASVRAAMDAEAQDGAPASEPTRTTT